MASSIELRNVRAIDGTQARGFEHLCYQLREPPPEGWVTLKTGDPDGGAEWYHTAGNGDVAAFQCKFVWNVDDLIGGAKTSFDTVARNLAARRVRTLTFYIPFDLPDQAVTNTGGRKIKSARAKWDDAVARWVAALPAGDKIDVRLLSGGDVLERLFADGNQGRVKFFFDKDLLTHDWFDRKLRSSIDLADERYTPESNVDLVIGRDIDALRLDNRFVEAMVAAKSGARDKLARLIEGLDRGATLHPLAIAGDLDRLEVLRTGGIPTILDRLAVRFSVSDVIDDIGELEFAAGLLSDVARDLRAHRTASGGGDDDGTIREHEGSWARQMNDRVDAAEAAVAYLLRMYSSPGAAAAESGALLITGEAGQGKTHLLIDSTRRALADGGFAFCILGEMLNADADIISQIPESLGLGQMAHDQFLEMLAAAAQTTASRLLISIDALNESGKPERWPSQLVKLVSELKNYPDLALVVTCRTDFEDIVLPPLNARKKLGIVDRRHPGFLGRELEALEAYFRTVPNAWPKAPLLQPDFSSPLFVKLYAGGFEGLTTEESAAYDRHRSAVFERFVDSRVRRINRRLHLDPNKHKVEMALRAFDVSLSDTGASRLLEEKASELIESFAPERTEWPDTLFQALLSEGVIGRAVIFADATARPAIQFAYQALGDYRIAGAALLQHRDELDVVRTGQTLLDASSPLRNWYAGAARNIRQAFVVLYAEDTGHELIDGLYADAEATYAACVDAGSWSGNEILRELLTMTIETIPHRRPSSVTERTVDLSLLTRGLRPGVSLWDSSVAVTAEPGHILNADRLHRMLGNAGRVQRDAFWIKYSWWALSDDTSTLLRLIRWGERTATPARLTPGRVNADNAEGADAEVVRLAATTLIWLLTTSNRFVRDRVTKALVQLLLGHGPTLVGLLDRFLVVDVRKIDDSYLNQRLVAVAYGWVMRVGHYEIEVTKLIAEFMRDHVLAADSEVNRRYPDILTRDSAQGIVDLATRIVPGFSSDTHPPYSSSRPANPPTKEILEERYPRDPKDRSHSWASLHGSIFSLGDFGTYEVEPAVRNISLQRRTDGPAVPFDWDGGSRRVERKWAEFLDSLEPELRERAEKADAEDMPVVLDLYLELDQNQMELLNLSTKRIKTKRQTVSRKWARRWIFNEVARMGWTPERFAEIEAVLTGDRYDRRGHKAERIGKKYQWIALHRLLAKLLDNNHYVDRYTAVTHDYAGAWQLGLRDIDPSLPPAYFEPPNYYESDTTEWSENGRAARANGSSFADASTAEWDFKSRDMPEPAAAAAWVLSDQDLPSLDERLIRTSSDGQRWVVLSEYVTHVLPSDSDAWDDGSAQEWSHIDAWLVKPDQADVLTRYLEGQTLMGKWMPGGGDRTGSYLGEIGWSSSWDNLDAGPSGDPAAQFGTELGERIAHRLPTDDSDIEGIALLPAFSGYLWESSTADCSIEESVNVTFPTPALLAASSIHRDPDRPDWYQGRRRIATNVTFRDAAARGSMLLVNEDWLVGRLADEGWVLVAGLLGERSIRADANKVWRQFDHIAQLGVDGWKYGELRPAVKRAHGEVEADV